jgi:hypothetical protein
MTMRLAVASAAAVLAACGSDTLHIALQISSGPVQACPYAAGAQAPTCSDVPMRCDSVLHIRIVRPSRPLESYLPLCQEIPRAEQDLCSLELINLPVRQLPKETLEVQVMIWPRAAVKTDELGAPDCHEIYGQPVSVQFGVHGFPEESVPAPALGGRAFYHPGDALTVVTLGCSDLREVNQPACVGPVEILASVDELDFLGAPLAQPASVLVSFGEPRYMANRDEHEWRHLGGLAAAGDGRWSGGIDELDLEDSICVDVQGNLGASTPTVRCVRPAVGARRLMLAGTWLPSQRLQQFVSGLGYADVPPEGLTIGIVLDPRGRPAEGYRVETRPAENVEVKYLDASGAVVGGATATVEGGLFVSENAPYGTDFRAYQGTAERTLQPGVGGRVRGKVTLVVLQL